MRRALSVAALAVTAIGTGAGAAQGTPVHGAGQWGNGNPTPAPVAGVTEASKLAEGDRNVAIGLFGTTVRPVNSTLPHELTNASAISAANSGLLAVVTEGGKEGVVKQAGAQPSQASERKLETSWSWTTVKGLEEGAIAVSQGGIDGNVSAKNEDLGVHDLALMANGTVRAWGDNEDCQVGGSAETLYYKEPIEIALPHPAIAVSAGGGQNLALLNNGTVWAWGENALGQLGDGKEGPKWDTCTPVQVAGFLGTVSAVAAGGEDSLALLSNGHVLAWGGNHKGELGIGTSSGTKDTPVEISGLSGVTAIAASATGSGDTDHNFALLESGRLMGWGANSSGEVGDGNKEAANSPVEVAFAPEVVVTAFAAGTEGGIAAGPFYPILESITPINGSVEGGTVVTIKGKNLLGATEVHFGTVSGEILSDSEEEIKAKTPAEGPKKVNVTVTTAIGTSAASKAVAFVFEPTGETIELGRCLNVGKGLGEFSNSKCTEGEAGGKFQFSKEIIKPGFAVAQKEKVTIETAAGTLTTCRGLGGGGGTYAPPKGVGGTTLALTECNEGTAISKSAPKCTSPGAAEGEVRTSVLEGVIGFESKELNNAALALTPAEEGALFMKFTCAGSGATTEIRTHGNAYGTFGVPDSSTTSMKLVYGGSKGKPHTEGFEGKTGEYLEASTGGSSFVKANLNGSFAITNEEAIEINTVV